MSRLKLIEKRTDRLNLQQEFHFDIKPEFDFALMHKISIGVIGVAACALRPQT